MDRTFNVLQIEHGPISSKDIEIAAENSQKATEDAKTYINNQITKSNENSNSQVINRSR